LKRIAAVLGEIDETRSAVVDRRNDLLTVRDKLVNPSVALGESIEQLQTTAKARLAGIFRAEQAPLWSPRIRESLHKEWQTVGPQIVLEWVEENGQVSREPSQTLGFQLVLFVALGLSLRWLRDRTRVKAQDDNRVRSAQLVFEHPWAMAVLLTTVLTVPLDPLARIIHAFVGMAFRG
jgi:potassium-dependent mechanosensitive channel